MTIFTISCLCNNTQSWIKEYLSFYLSWQVGILYIVSRVAHTNTGSMPSKRGMAGESVTTLLRPGSHRPSNTQHLFSQQPSSHSYFYFYKALDCGHHILTSHQQCDNAWILSAGLTLTLLFHQTVRYHWIYLIRHNHGGNVLSCERNVLNKNNRVPISYSEWYECISLLCVSRLFWFCSFRMEENNFLYS